MSLVTIIGAGLMGTSLCWPLADNRHEIRLVGTPLDEEIIRNIRSTGTHPRLERKIPDGIRTYTSDEIPQSLDGTDFIISGVSSFGVDWFAQAVGPYLTPEVPLLSVTKGLEMQSDGTLVTILDALNSKLPSSQKDRISLNAIGGPCTALELAVRRQTAVVFCGKDLKILEKFRKILATEYYHISISSDVVGVETCAALKNAYALGVSLAAGMMEQAGQDGLAWMYNPQAALFGQSCLEMSRLVKFLGGHDINVIGLPGAGDLYVTIYGGRTRRLGILLGKGMPFVEARQVLEGVTLESVEIINRVTQALPLLDKRGLLKQSDFPLLMHLDAILNQGATVDIPWEQFTN